jgi:DNA-binding GntR family transcriptional regulator
MRDNGGKADGKPRAEASEGVFDEVRRAIINGEYLPGSRLVETQLADALEVSRTPVREALVRLAAEGFVDLIRNRGAFVAKWSDHDLEEIFGLRVLLEGYGLRIAATKIRPDEIADLEELAESMDEALAARKPGYVEVCTNLNTRFHRTLVDASRNQRLSAMVSQLTQLPLIHRTIRMQDPAELGRSFAQHRDMITAMKVKDGDWAESLMRAHILAGRDVMRRALGDGDSVDGRALRDGDGVDGRS